jgi:hypothetical protein
MSNGEVARHPLGLPPGSVRGVLSLLIAIQFWVLLLLPDTVKVPPVPVNLYLLMSLVVIFFVSHGKSIAGRSEPTPSPLNLPGGTLRFIIIGGTIAVVAYLWVNFPDRLANRLRPSAEQIAFWPTIVGAYVGGFLVGFIFKLLPIRNNWLFQAFMAWLSFIAVLMFLIEIFIHAFINTKIEEMIDMRMYEAVVTAITSAYFGMRS